GVNARLAVGIEVRLKKLEEGLREAAATTETGMTRIERRTKAAAERIAANVEAVKLSQKLDVARAAGNTKMVEHLSEEIALRKTINDLTRAGIKGEEARAIAEAHVHALAKANAGKEGVAGAARHIFDQSRLTVFEEGGARLGIYGGALEKLGAAGLIAAAGLFAAAEAAEHAHKAMEYADEIDDTAKRLHVTTDALQEYRFALGEVGGAEKGADEALESFSSMLGKAQAGLPKALRAFKELGFTPEQVKGFNTVEEALDAVTEKIAGLGKNVQKDAVIDQLGLTGMKPLLEAGIEKMNELRAEARDLGIVMDAELLKRGAELNKRFEVLSKVVDVQLKEAFIGLAPVLIVLLKQVAEFAAEVNDAVQSMKSVEERGTHTLQRQAGQLRDRANREDRQAAFFRNMPGPIGSFGAWSNTLAAKKDREQEAKIVEELKGRSKPTEQSPPKGGSLVDQSKTPKEKSDKTGATAKSIDDALDEAQKRLLEAMAALTGDVQEHADLEKQAVDAEYRNQVTDLNAARDALDKGVADGSINAEKATQLKAEIAQTLLADMATANAKKRNIDIGAQISLEQKALQRAEAIAGFDSQTRSVAIALAATRAQRLQLELEQLDADKALADRKRKQERDDAALRRKPGDQDIVVTYDARQAAADRAYNAQRQQIQAQNLSPWDAWAKQGRDAAANIGDAMQSEAVKEVEEFNSQLIDSEGHIHSAGDALRAMWRLGLADLERYLLKQAEVGIFGGASPTPGNFQFGAPKPTSIFSMIAGLFGGHADGTDSSPGGWKWVGERGPELMNVSRGATVLSNANIRRLTSMPAMPQGGPTVTQHFHLDARGAVMTEDLVSGMRDYSDAVGTRAAQAGAELAPAQRASMTIALPALPWLARAKPKLLEFGTDLQPTLGGPRQWIARLGTRHAIEVDMPTLDPTTFAAWNAARKKSRATGVELVLTWPQPLGPINVGAPVIDGAGQAGTQLAVRGLTASVNVPQGGYLTLTSGGRLYLHSVTDAAIANGSGRAILSIEPMLRISPADADAISFTPTIQGFIDGVGLDWDDQFRRWQRFSFTLSESA
ncbi:Hypothetical predicted protein, partial [Olea europaea subsp. europaea]